MRLRAGFHRRVSCFALSAGLGASAAFADERLDGIEKIAWDHPTLSLHLSRVIDAGDRARLELCVSPKPGVSAGSTSVGFPRYRTAWGRWVDGVTQGVGGDRALETSAGKAPACISVLVSREATALLLPIGGQMLELEIGPWLAASEAATPARVEVRDPWARAPQATPPEVVLTGDYLVAGVPTPIPRDRIVNVRLYAHNVGGGTARDVVAWIEPASGVFSAQDGAERIELGELAPGAIAEFVYRCYADRRATALSFQVAFDHRSAAAGGGATVISLPLADALPETAPSLPGSDVDRIVPHSARQRPTGLAVVLGVEAYASAPRATYAAADARTAALYFEQALGIPAERIELLLDGEVTLGQLQRLFGEDGWLARRTRADSEIFVFFAGHGVAELEEFSPYLLPTDADPNYLRQTALSLDRLMKMLGALGARSTTLFLDACFGGLSREGAALRADARPLVIVPTQSAPAGVSLFSAGGGGQVASSLEEQGHGLFSYHLFKGLSGAADVDANRLIVAGELKHYLEDAVPRAAEALDREQFPAIALDDPDQLLVELP